MASKDPLREQLQKWQAEKGRPTQPRRPGLPVSKAKIVTIDSDTTRKPFKKISNADYGHVAGFKQSDAENASTVNQMNSILGKRRANESVVPESQLSRRKLLDDWKKEKQQKTTISGVAKPAFVASGHLDYRRYTMDALPKFGASKGSGLLTVTTMNPQAPLPTKQSARRQTMIIHNKPTSVSLKPSTSALMAKPSAFNSKAERFPATKTIVPLRKPELGLRSVSQPTVKIGERAKPPALIHANKKQPLPLVRPRSKTILAGKPNRLASISPKSIDSVVIKDAKQVKKPVARKLLPAPLPSSTLGQDLIDHLDTITNEQSNQMVESIDHPRAAVKFTMKPVRKSLSALHRASVTAFKKPATAAAKMPAKFVDELVPMSGGDAKASIPLNSSCTSSNKRSAKKTSKINACSTTSTISRKSILAATRPKSLLTVVQKPSTSSAKSKSVTTSLKQQSLLPPRVTQSQKGSPRSPRVLSSKVGSTKRWVAGTPVRQGPIYSAVRGRVATPAAGGANKTKPLNFRLPSEVVQKSSNAIPVEVGDVASPRRSMAKKSSGGVAPVSCSRRFGQCTPSITGILKTVGRKSARKSVAFDLAISGSSKWDPSLRANLDTWLANKKLTPSICRHLHCLGTGAADSLIKKNVKSPVTPLLGRKNTPKLSRRSRTQFAGHTPLKRISSNITINEYFLEEDDGQNINFSSPASPPHVPKLPLASPTDITMLQGAHKDLMKLLDASYPPQQVSEWLDELYLSHPVVQELAEYWECRSKVSASCGDVQDAMQLLDRGIHLNAQPLGRLMNAKESLGRTSGPSKKRTPRRKSVDAKNAFKSTVVQFEVVDKSAAYTKIFDIAECQSPVPLALVTPVRRSRRLSHAKLLTPIPATPSSDRRATFCVEALDDIPSDFRRNIFYAENPNVKPLMTMSPDLPSYLLRRVFKSPRL